MPASRNVGDFWRPGRGATCKPSCTPRVGLGKGKDMLLQPVRDVGCAQGPPRPQEQRTGGWAASHGASQGLKCPQLALPEPQDAEPKSYNN